MDLLKSLIIESEKAANIARTIRENEHLFELLVQKKGQAEANPRFVDDFKTLADVLIQEMVKHDIAKNFPALLNSIRGEENNVFSNKLGKSVCVKLLNDSTETACLLKEVLAGDEEAANVLATEAHKDLDLQDVNTTPLPNEEIDISLDDCAIWIDPIDSTAEYINGVEKLSDTGICTSGLKCATVLIGVYSKTSHRPIMGVINQPFSVFEDSRWRGHCIWGLKTESHEFSWRNEHPTRNNTIMLSSSEDERIKASLRKRFKLVEAAGVGYKILSVLLGDVDAYIISKSSTYKWDTCGPHAILKSLGGEILNYSELVRGNKIPIKYPEGVDEHCNKGGLLAYRDSNVLTDIIECLTSP